MNALTFELFAEFEKVFDQLLSDPTKDVRAIVLTSTSQHFTAGLDLKSAMQIGELNQAGSDTIDTSRIALAMQRMVGPLQRNTSVVERCRVPVICALSGCVIGAGIDISSACDIRICSSDTKFSIREIDIGMCADLGTIQRFQKVVGSDSFFRELAYTGRFFDSQEALKQGYVSYVTGTREECQKQAYELAKNIATKSPVGIATLKQNIVFSRDHSVEEGLNHILLLNMSMLQTKDMQTALMATFQK